MGFRSFESYVVRPKDPAKGWQYEYSNGDSIELVCNKISDVIQNQPKSVIDTIKEILYNFIQQNGSTAVIETGSGWTASVKDKTLFLNKQ